MHHKPVFAALLLTLTACGVEEPSDQDTVNTAPDQLTTGVTPAPKVLATGALDQTVELRAAPLRPLPGRVISVEGALTATTGTPVRVALAIMGCGYMVIGQGQGAVSGNHVSVNVTIEEETGYGTPSVFVFVDNDKDGTCDVEKGDALLETHVEGEEATLVSTSSLTAGDGWMCNMFNYP